MPVAIERELRVNTANGIRARVGERDALEPLAVDDRIVLALACFQVEEIRIDCADDGLAARFKRVATIALVFSRPRS